MQEDPTQALLALVERALADGQFIKLTLSKPRPGAPTDARKVAIRPLLLKGEPRLSFVHAHPTRDVTRNLTHAEGLAEVGALLAASFQHAHLQATQGETQLLTSRKGRQTLITGRPPAGAAPAATVHDREKHRFLDLDRPFLGALGVADAGHHLVPAMARKWKQINKFVEVLDHALQETGLKAAERLSVVDFGSGKGYLTFATHDHLRHGLGLPAEVTGVELREDMVRLCNGVVGGLGLEGLHFEEGDVRSVVPAAVDVMIALHACDTATDHAIHTGVRAGARVIMCSPCCHKELRPQLLSPHPLRPILKHGVHLGQQADMLTDGLRAMLLDACGYETRVFEFVALEHTSKNKMILALRRPDAAPAPEVWQQIDDIKAFYGIRDQCLERLLKADAVTAPVAAARTSPIPAS